MQGLAFQGVDAEGEPTRATNAARAVFRDGRCIGFLRPTGDKGWRVVLNGKDVGIGKNIGAAKRLAEQHAGTVPADVGLPLVPPANGDDEVTTRKKSTRKAAKAPQKNAKSSSESAKKKGAKKKAQTKSARSTRRKEMGKREERWDRSRKVRVLDKNAPFRGTVKTRFDDWLKNGEKTVGGLYDAGFPARWMKVQIENGVLKIAS